MCIFHFQEGLRVAQAIFLGLIVSYIESSSGITMEQAYYYTLGWTLTYILVTAFDNLGFHKSYYYGLKMRVACTSLVYRKVSFFYDIYHDVLCTCM